MAGLNPERVVASAIAIGQACFAIDKDTDYAKKHAVWGGKPIGTHQGVAAPLVQSHIEVELAKQEPPIRESSWGSKLR